MNIFIESQIKNMLLLAENFDKACSLAALKDDGKISRDEEKMLKAIHKAVERFTNDLKSVK